MAGFGIAQHNSDRSPARSAAKITFGDWIYEEFT
jgi:hypothetical protein